MQTCTSAHGAEKFGSQSTRRCDFQSFHAVLGRILSIDYCGNGIVLKGDGSPVLGHAVLFRLNNVNAANQTPPHGVRL
jgi:hypothetical protein